MIPATENSRLWLQVSPSVFKRYAPDSKAKVIALSMIRQGRWGYGFKDKNDWNRQRARMYRFIHASNRYHYEKWGQRKTGAGIAMLQLLRWGIIRTANRLGPNYSLMN
ncbi:MAG TPA: hypothetical protein DCW31_01010 [Lactobacillus sp.]|nr:hypothetical protein [Lactobacillus sp.]